jgi:agmatinase
MIRVNGVVGNTADPDIADEIAAHEAGGTLEKVRIDSADRRKSRLWVETDAGTDIGVLVDEPELAAGDVLVLDSGTTSAVLGGDHSTTLPVLGAIAEKHGPVGLVQFDAHSDLWTGFFGESHNHGTTVHTAIEEGLIDPERSIRIGDRGGLYGEEDIELFESAGIEYHTIKAVTDQGIDAICDRIAAVTDGPTFATIDIDALDPAYAPGTGTPMPGGMTSREIIRLTRSLADAELVGFDLVEVAPPYDDNGTTAILAANIVFEALSTTVDQRG